MIWCRIYLLHIFGSSAWRLTNYNILTLINKLNQNWTFSESFHFHDNFSFLLSREVGRAETFSQKLGVYLYTPLACDWSMYTYIGLPQQWPNHVTQGDTLPNHVITKWQLPIRGLWDGNEVLISTYSCRNFGLLVKNYDFYIMLESQNWSIYFFPRFSRSIINRVTVL